MKKIISLVLAGLFVLTAALPAAFAQGTLPAVDNFKVEKVGNRTVTLKWDAVLGATNYTILYGTSSVTNPDQEYNRPPVETQNVNTYKLDNLTNGTKYYFNIFAASGQDISTSLSDEVSATPSAEGTNAAPTILESKAVSPTQFNLVFSKEMKFPANLVNEITITKSFDQSPLRVVSAVATNPTTLSITTDPQDVGSEYIVRISNKFMDQANVVVAENERSDVLIGSNSDSNLYGAAGETGDLQILEAIVAPDKQAVELVFNKSVVLESNSTSQIAIVETSSPASTSLSIKQVIPNAEDDKKMLVVTDELKPVSYTLLALRFKDKEGKFMSEENSTIEFNGAGVGVQTVGEVTDLQAQFVDVAKLLVNLTWGVNPDVDAAALAGYKVYLAEGSNGAFALLSELQSTDTSFDTESLNPADLYKFKVTTIGADGVESEGAIAELILPGTGPAGLLAIFAGSLGLGRFVTRRKN